MAYEQGQRSAAGLKLSLNANPSDTPPPGRRYGDLPGWEELETWVDRVLDAKRLEDVFGSD